MTQIALLIHGASAIIFTLGMVLLFAFEEDVTNTHVAAAVALLGLNAAVHYFRAALESDTNESERSYERRRIEREPIPEQSVLSQREVGDAERRTIERTKRMMTNAEHSREQRDN